MSPYLSTSQGAPSYLAKRDTSPLHSESRTRKERKRARARRVHLPLGLHLSPQVRLPRLNRLVRPLPSPSGRLSKIPSFGFQKKVHAELAALTEQEGHSSPCLQKLRSSASGSIPIARVFSPAAPGLQELTSANRERNDYAWHRLSDPGGASGGQVSRGGTLCPTPCPNGLGDEPVERRQCGKKHAHPS